MYANFQAQFFVEYFKKLSVASLNETFAGIYVFFPYEKRKRKKRICSQDDPSELILVGQL